MAVHENMEKFGLVIKIEFKEYRTIIQYNENDKVYFGKIEGINDLMLFEGDTLEEACDAFVDVVYDYLELKGIIKIEK